MQCILTCLLVKVTLKKQRESENVILSSKTGEDGSRGSWGYCCSRIQHQEGRLYMYFLMPIRQEVYILAPGSVLIMGEVIAMVSRTQRAGETSQGEGQHRKFPSRHLDSKYQQESRK